jgi:uncharacterized repeat protein (TIGR01451 family)
VEGLPTGATVTCIPATQPVARLGVGAEIVCTVGYTAPADEASVTVTGTVGTTTDQGTNTAPDTASVTTRIIPVADLAVTKTDEVATVVQGGTTTYTIVVTNSGPSPVTGATARVPVPGPGHRHGRD